MIEHCFRAKRLDNDEWVYGYYARYGYTGNKKEVIIPLYASELYAIDVKSETVTRWIGLADKYGNPIYEGDIVDIDEQDGAFIIEYEEDDAAFTLINRDGDKLSFVEHIYGVDCKIVGNFYDNPELMEDEDE